VYSSRAACRRQKDADLDSTMRRFESCRPSQAVRQLEIVAFEILEMPANWGLLEICAPSPSSQFTQSQSEIADSLWRIFEIFPFLGDSDRRLGSIYTAWREPQSYRGGLKQRARRRFPQLW
jgi:hypothetical protein